MKTNYIENKEIIPELLDLGWIVWKNKWSNASQEIIDHLQSDIDCISNSNSYNADSEFSGCFAVENDNNDEKNLYHFKDRPRQNKIDVGTIYNSELIVKLSIDYDRNVSFGENSQNMIEATQDFENNNN